MFKRDRTGFQKVSTIPYLVVKHNWEDQRIQLEN